MHVQVQSTLVALHDPVFVTCLRETVRCQEMCSLSDINACGAEWVHCYAATDLWIQPNPSHLRMILLVPVRYTIEQTTFLALSGFCCNNGSQLDLVIHSISVFLGLLRDMGTAVGASRSALGPANS